MQNINLLPWRQKSVQHYRKRFWIKLTIMFMLLLSLLFAIHQINKVNLVQQEFRNQRLNQEINKLNQSVNIYTAQNKTLNKLEKRTNIINSLQLQRNNVTLIFNLLPQITPQSLTLDKVSFVDGVVTLKGRSPSNDQLTKLIAKLEIHPEIQNLQMHSIINQVKNKITQFEATFNLNSYIKTDLQELLGG